MYMDFVISIAWEGYKRGRESRDRDSSVTRSIHNIDCYAVHISKTFITWLKKNYDLFRMYTNHPSTPVARFADVALVELFKNCSRAHTIFCLRGQGYGKHHASANVQCQAEGVEHG